MEQEVLAVKKRREILEHIEKFPGCYLREIQKTLDLSLGVLQYHLDYLEKREIVSSREEGKRKRYFVKEDVRYRDRKIISILRIKRLREIVIFLLLNPNSSFSEIQKAQNISKSALSFHLKKLKSAEILKEGKREREKIFWVENSEEIAQVLVTYKKSFLDAIVDGFVGSGQRFEVEKE